MFPIFQHMVQTGMSAPYPTTVHSQFAAQNGDTTTVKVDQAAAAAAAAAAAVKNDGPPPVTMLPPPSVGPTFSPPIGPGPQPAQSIEPIAQQTVSIVSLMFRVVFFLMLYAFSWKYCMVLKYLKANCSY